MEEEMNDSMICPHCNEMIENLIEERHSVIYYTVFPEGDAFGAQLNEYGDDLAEPQYFCPSCDKLLAVGEAEAKRLFTNPMNNPEHIELLNEKLKQDEQESLSQNV
ncbi:MAG: hypothetical protein EOL98_13955 [Negativicutes bacterium]|nr:hypothetical protein [Negativicutes bacterium]